MARENIIGRINETEILSKAQNTNNSEFIAVYGRRRVGKTYLVREFFNEKICFELVGIHHASLKEQLANFSKSMSKSIGIGIPSQIPGTWFEAFAQLELYLDSLKLDTSKGKLVVFFDELPWLNTPKSKFLPSLEQFWNSYGSKQQNLILVICGSAASWMIQKIVRSKGGLHNRLTRQIRLLPFTLSETELFLKSRDVELTRFQIISLYMVMGGVPFYLMQAEPGLSSTQIIDKTCFTKDGLLRTEFENLFASLFDKGDQHNRIVDVLRKNRSGMTRNEILLKAKVPSGGSASLIMGELEESGFISSAVPLGKKSNDAIFRISDEFTLFYFDWIKPLGKGDPGMGYWLLRQNDPRRKAWAGYAWEGICTKHVRQIKNSLGIAMVETFSGPWRHTTPKGSGQAGAQIDMLIDRRDGCINICEMKFSESEFTIDAKYMKEIRQKEDVLKLNTKTRKNIFITMVTTFGIQQNSYAKEIVSQSLTMDSLF